MKLCRRHGTRGALLWITASLLGAVAMTTTVTSEVCPVSPASCMCDTHLHGSKVKVKRIVCTDAGRGHMNFPKFNKSAKGLEEFNEAIDKVSFIYAGLKEVPHTAFGKVDIYHLDLQGNDLRDRISAKAFYGVAKSLRSLNLAWSNITSLSTKVFRGMVSLRNLSLAENRLRAVSGSIFHHLRSVRRLSLAGNPLSQLPGSVFRYQTTLEMLDLGYCRLSRLPWTLLFGLWNLKLLDLRGNRLTSLEPYTFMDLSLLHTLLLGHNPLRRIQADVFHGLHALSVLRLEESQIEHVSREAFRDLVNLRTLDLGDNSLRHLPPRSLARLANVEVLSLDGNRLTEFPVDVMFLPRLRSLDVSYNNIRTLDACLYGTLVALDFLNLQENRLVCDCRLLWLKSLRIEMFRKWRQSSSRGGASGRRRDLSGPFVPGRCSSPSHLRGVGATSWLDLDCLSKGRPYGVSTTAPPGGDTDACLHGYGKTVSRRRDSRRTDPRMGYLYHPLG